MIARVIGLGTQDGDNFAVHLHPALRNHLLSLAAAGDAGPGQNFLQSLKIGGGTRSGSEIRFGFGVEAVFDYHLGVGFVVFGFDPDFGRCSGFAIGLVSDWVFYFVFGCGRYFRLGGFRDEAFGFLRLFRHGEDLSFCLLLWERLSRRDLFLGYIRLVFRSGARRGIVYRLFA